MTERTAIRTRVHADVYAAGATDERVAVLRLLGEQRDGALTRAGRRPNERDTLELYATRVRTLMEQIEAGLHRDDQPAAQALEDEAQS